MTIPTRLLARFRSVSLCIAIGAPVVGYVALHVIHAITESWVLSAADKVEKKDVQDLPLAFYSLMDSVSILDVGVALQAVGVAAGAAAGIAAFVGFRAHESRPNQSPQHNAGSRPSSVGSPAPETPSSHGPRG